MLPVVVAVCAAVAADVLASVAHATPAWPVDDPVELVEADGRLFYPTGQLSPPAWPPNDTAARSFCRREASVNGTAPLMIITLPFTASSSLSRLADKIMAEPGLGQVLGSMPDAKWCCDGDCPAHLLQAAVAASSPTIKTHSDVNHLLGQRLVSGQHVNAVAILRHPEGWVRSVLRKSEFWGRGRAAPPPAEPQGKRDLAAWLDEQPWLWNANTRMYAGNYSREVMPQPARMPSQWLLSAPQRGFWAQFMAQLRGSARGPEGQPEVDPYDGLTPELAAAWGHDRGLLAQAQHHLQHTFAAFALFEALPDSLELLAHTFCWDPEVVQRIVAENNAEAAKPLKVGVRVRALELNKVLPLSEPTARRLALDVELWEFARGLFEQRRGRMLALRQDSTDASDVCEARLTMLPGAPPCVVRCATRRKAPAGKRRRPKKQQRAPEVHPEF